MSEHPMQAGSTEQSPKEFLCVSCVCVCVCVWGGGGGGGGRGPPGPSPGSATAGICKEMLVTFGGVSECQILMNIFAE